MTEEQAVQIINLLGEIKDNILIMNGRDNLMLMFIMIILFILAFIAGLKLVEM